MAIQQREEFQNKIKVLHKLRISTINSEDNRSTSYSAKGTDKNR